MRNHTNIRSRCNLSWRCYTRSNESQPAIHSQKDTTMAKSNGKKEWLNLIQSAIQKVNRVRASQRAKQIYLNRHLLSAMAVALFERPAIDASETDTRSWCFANRAVTVSVDSLVHPNHAKKVSIARPDNTVRARIGTFVELASDKAATKDLNARERKALAMIQTLTYCRFVQNGSPAASDESNADAKKVFVIRVK